MQETIIQSINQSTRKMANIATFGAAGPASRIQLWSRGPQCISLPYESTIEQFTAKS